MPVPALPSPIVSAVENRSLVLTRAWRAWAVGLSQMFRGSPIGRGITYCAGTPEGQIVGSIGDVALRTDGGAGTTLYIKESGSATDTGWVAK